MPSARPDAAMPSPSCPACGCPLPTPVPAMCPNLACGKMLLLRARRVPDGPPPEPSAVSRRTDATPAPTRRPSWHLPAAAAAVTALVVGVGVSAVALLRKTDAPPVVATTPAPTTTPPPPPAVPMAADKPLTQEQVYRRLLDVSVLIVAGDGIGSGAVVDRDRRLVLTNAHVVGGGRSARVVFPAFDPAGQVLVEAAAYPGLAATAGVPARVVGTKPAADLALLELDRLPAGAKAVAVSGGSAPTGGRVFSVGASATVRAGQLWRFTPGSVRNRGRQQYRDGDGQRDAVFLETDAPINPGDSGGAVVDDRGRLVAVVASLDPRVRAVSNNVDAEEVRAFLTEAVPAARWAWADPTAGSPVADELAPLRAALTGPPADRATAARRIAGLGAAGRPAVPDLLNALPAATEDAAAALLAAVEAVGPPSPADTPAVVRLLSAADPAVRRFAAGRFAAGPVPEEAVRPLAALLADGSAGVRAAAVAAVARVGPGGRREVLPPLVGCTADRTPEVAAAAKKAVFDPAWSAAYTADDLPALRTGLRAADPDDRAAFVGLAAKLYPDAVAAVADLLPACDDPAGAVRAAALAGLERWGAAAKAAGPAVRKLCDDPSPAVRQAAYKFLPSLVTPAEVARTYTERYLSEPDTSARLPLGRSLARSDLSSADPKIIGRMLGDGDPTALRALLPQLSRRPDGSESAAALLGRAELPDDVRAAAVDALGAAGPSAAKHAPAVARVAAPVGREPAAPGLQLAAARALVRFGPAAAPAVVGLLGHLHNADAAAAVCDGLGQWGRAAAGPKAAGGLVELSERLPAAREPAGRALVRFGGDEVAAALERRIRWVANSDGPPVPADVRGWAYQLLAELDPKAVSAAQRGRLTDRLFAAKFRDPDRNNQPAAEAAWERLRVKR